MNNEPQGKWQNKRTLVMAWIIMFFPIGLYGVWTGELFDRQKKWILTGAVIMVLLVFSSGGILDFLVAVILAPLAVFLCWRDPEVAKRTTYLFGAGAVVIFVFYLNSFGSESTSITGHTCEAVQVVGSCTYYRDSNCNVIGQSCE